jgi:SAM-dependent methyltransferase
VRPLVAARQRVRGLRRLAHARGSGYALRFTVRWALFRLWAPWARGRAFFLDGERYEYFLHAYNLTWSNERAVEVPVVWRLVQSLSGGRVLEVGNVLAHYYPVRHDVVDKFERAPGVINADAADFDTPRRYDLIVSISTLEHVGFDEEPREPDKPLRALANLRRLLAPGGLLCATLPVGYNPHVDALLAEGALGRTRLLALRRVSDDNLWMEATWEGVKDCGYADRWPGAGGIVFLFVRN